MTTAPSPYLSLSFETVEARIWATETINGVFADSAKLRLPTTAYQKPLPPAPINEKADTIFDPNCFLSGSHSILDMPVTTDVNIANITTINTTNSLSRPRRHTTSCSSSSSSSSSSSIVSISSSSSLSLSLAKDQPHHDDECSTRTNILSSDSSMSDCISLSGQSDPGVSTYHHHHHHQRSDTPQSSTTVFSTASAPCTPTSSPARLLSRRSTLTKRLKRNWTLNDSSSSSVRRLFTSEQLLKERKAWSMWRETLHGYLLDPAFTIPAPRYTNDSSRLAYCIVSELLATEETYLRHLSMLKQMFIDPFLQTFQNRYVIRDLQTLFSHIPQLIILSSSLVRRWCISIERQTQYADDKITVRDSSHEIGKAFCDMEDEFKVYTYYALHFAKAQKCISRLEQKPSYQQWMHKEIQRMGLADYLISPIQRITRYCLLVKDLMKHTARHDVNLERAYKYLTALAVAMNNCQQ